MQFMKKKSNRELIEMQFHQKIKSTNQKQNRGSDSSTVISTIVKQHSKKTARISDVRNLILRYEATGIHI